MLRLQGEKHRYYKFKMMCSMLDAGLGKILWEIISVSAHFKEWLSYRVHWYSHFIGWEWSCHITSRFFLRSWVHSKIYCSHLALITWWRISEICLWIYSTKVQARYSMTYHKTDPLCWKKNKLSVTKCFFHTLVNLEQLCMCCTIGIWVLC